MGKGDQRTKRGKITIGSYGKSRPHKTKTAVIVPVVVKAVPVVKPVKEAKPAAPKTERKKKA